MKNLKSNSITKRQAGSKFQTTIHLVKELFDKNINNNMKEWYSELFGRFINLIKKDNLNDSKSLNILLDIYKTLFVKCKISNMTIPLNLNNNFNLNVA